MAIRQLDTENGDYDLTGAQTVLTHTPDANQPTLCQGYIALGDGAKDLDGSGGDFEVTIVVGSQTIQPSSEVIVFGTEVRAGIWTAVFPVPANTQVQLKIKSPNAADVDVDVTAELYEVSGVWSLSTISSLPEVDAKSISDDATAEIADAVFDEARADHTDSSTFGGALQDVYHADIHFQRDDDETKDRYVVRWYKNGLRLTSGITSPTISVYDLTDGSTLINAESMTDVGSGMLLYTEDTDRQTLGTPYEVVISATIDGSTRTFSKDLGRDT